jgi:hypothetical protein
METEEISVQISVPMRISDSSTSSLSATTTGILSSQSLGSAQTLSSSQYMGSAQASASQALASESAARCETVADERLSSGASSAARCETVADLSLPCGATSSSTRCDPLVPLVVTASVELRPDHGGHRAEGVEYEDDNGEISDNESCLGLTDSSSEDDSVTPGERVRRQFGGVVKFRRARRSRKRFTQPTIEPSSED